MNIKQTNEEFERLAHKTMKLRDDVEAIRAKWGKVAYLLCGVEDPDLDQPEDYVREMIKAQVFSLREIATLQTAMATLEKGCRQCENCHNCRVAASLRKLARERS